MQNEEKTLNLTLLETIKMNGAYFKLWALLETLLKYRWRCVFAHVLSHLRNVSYDIYKLFYENIDLVRVIVVEETKMSINRYGQMLTDYIWSCKCC